jgi:hypothetical protein
LPAAYPLSWRSWGRTAARIQASQFPGVQQQSGAPGRATFPNRVEAPRPSRQYGSLAGILACGSRPCAAFPESRPETTCFQWLCRRSAIHLQLRGQLRSRCSFPHRPHSRLTLVLEVPSKHSPVCCGCKPLSNGFRPRSAPCPRWSGPGIRTARPERTAFPFHPLARDRRHKPVCFIFAFGASRTRAGFRGNAKAIIRQGPWITAKLSARRPQRAEHAR